MQHENSDDEFGFWADKPTQRIPRIRPRAGQRRHGDTGEQPAVATRPTMQRRAPASRRGEVTTRITEAPVAPYDVEAIEADVVHERMHEVVAKSPRGPIDPLLARLGALVLVVAMAVPMAMSFRSDNAVLLRADQAAASAAVDGMAAVDLAVAVDDTGIDVTAAAAADATAQAALEPASDPSAEPASVAEPVVVPSSVRPEDLPPATPVVIEEITSQAVIEEITSQAAPKVNTAAERSPAKPVCTKTYTVVAGDYWILIAKKVSVDVADLLAANGATTSTALYAGRSVCLPSHASSPTTVAPPTTVKPTPTTVKPTPTTVKPTPTTVKPPASYTRAQVEQIIRDVWPDELETEALRIATRESNLQPTAKNYCCYGLFQIYFNVHRSWLAGIGVTSSAQLFDPRVNATAAYTLYLRAGGWGPWKL